MIGREFLAVIKKNQINVGDIFFNSKWDGSDVLSSKFYCVVGKEPVSHEAPSGANGFQQQYVFYLLLHNLVIVNYRLTDYQFKTIFGLYEGHFSTLGGDEE